MKEKEITDEMKDKFFDAVDSNDLKKIHQMFNDHPELLTARTCEAEGSQNALDITCLTKKVESAQTARLLVSLGASLEEKNPQSGFSPNKVISAIEDDSVRIIYQQAIQAGLAAQQENIRKGVIKRQAEEPSGSALAASKAFLTTAEMQQVEVALDAVGVNGNPYGKSSFADRYPTRSKGSYSLQEEERKKQNNCCVIL